MYFNQMILSCCCLVFTLGSTSIVMAQEKKTPFADNIIGTLANKRMAGELELLDEQQGNIDQLMKDFGQLRREIGQDMKEQWEAADDEEKKELGKEYWRRVEEGRLDIVKEMKANLLPHQIDRLEQLSAQRMMNEGKGRETAGLLSDPMVSYLKLSEMQKKRIEDKSKKLKKEVAEKIQQILEDAKLELLAELNTDQKAKYEKLIGEPISKSDNEDDMRDSKKPSAQSRRL